MELKNFFAQDLQGNVIANPTVYLYQPDTTTLATGLQNANGSALSNPFTGTANGQIQFAAPDGNYDLRVVGTDRTFTMRVRFIDSVAGSAQLLRDDLASTSTGKGAALVGFKPTGGLSSTNVQSAIVEVVSDLAASGGAAMIGYMPAGASAVATTVQSKLQELPSVLDFGADPTNQTNSTDAFQKAINEHALVYIPDPSVGYLLSAGSITIPDGHGFIGGGKEKCVINITANAGNTTQTNAAFILGAHSFVRCVKINYPNQTVTDNVASIIQYPPTFYATNKVGVKLDLDIKGAYSAIHIDSGSWANWDVKILGSVISRFAYIKGHMGDTSTFDQCHIILNGAGWGGPVDEWCRQNAIGYQFDMQGGDRVDCLKISNGGIVGGSKAFYSTGSGLVWLQLSNFYIDIVIQAFVGKFSNVIGVAGNITCGDAYFAYPNKPAIEGNDSVFTLSSTVFSLGSTQSVCAFSGALNTIVLSGVKFSTSRGNYTPVASLSVGSSLSASGCLVITSNGTRKLMFSDVAAYDYAKVYVDGLKGFSKHTQDFSLTNGNMAAWSGGAPTGWTTSLASPSQWIRPISGVAGIEIQPQPASSGSFTLDIDLTASHKDSFGYYYVTCEVKIENNNGANSGNFSWQIGNPTDGWNDGNLCLGDTGSPAEPSSLPASQWQYVGFLLAAPLNPADTLKLRLYARYESGNNPVKLQIKSLQYWNAYTFYEAAGENASGHEFTRNESSNVRDYVVAGKRIRNRSSPPLADYSRVGERLYRHPPVVGQPKSWVCTATGDPGTWVSEGIL